MTTPIRKLLESLSAAVSKSPFQHMPMTVRNGPLQGYKWSLAPHSGYWRGVVEGDIQAAITQAKLAEGSCYWDLGAHFGYFSLLMGKFAGPNGKVFCFEPDPSSFARVKRHIRWNGVSNVFAFPYATDEKDGAVPLLQVPGQSSVSHLPYVGEEVPADALSVKAVRLDRLVEEGEIELPDFIKVDVEGHGAKSLIGAKDAISKAKPLILVSMHSERESVGCFELLKPLGYKAYRDSEEVFGPFERGTILFSMKQVGRLS